MFYEPPKDDHGLPLNPFSACIVPRPIGWVSTVDKDGRPNLAPFSFFNGVGYTPPTVMFSPNGRDLDGGLSHSLLNVQETKEFVVNIATFDLRYSVNLTSRQLKRGESEFKLAGSRRSRRAACGRPGSQIADPAGMPARPDRAPALDRTGLSVERRVRPGRGRPYQRTRPHRRTGRLCQAATHRPPRLPPVRGHQELFEMPTRSLRTARDL